MIFRRKKEKVKVFCIGRNKTGTTSLKNALKQLGYRIGSQKEAEMLMDDWIKRDFRRIVKLCREADAFQDIPFSLPYTYRVLDYEFPGSRFVLSVRNSADEWYNSLVRYHSKRYGSGKIPTSEDLRRATYRHEGWIWKAQQYTYGIDENTLYDRDIYVQHYERHNEDVKEYFRYRPDDLLVLNLSSPGAIDRLCEFLQIENPGIEMPHLNRSE